MKRSLYDHTTVSSPADIGSEEHFAALVFGTITIPGDQRSRDCPGHGYPESTETTTKYLRFENEDALKAWIENQDSGYSRQNYTIIRSTPIRVDRKIEINLK